MTKTAYAAHRRVDKSRVSQWLKAGQIGPEALDGEGRRSRIIVAVADQHLAERLDPDQRFGANGLKPAKPEPEQPPLTPVQTAESAIVAEKLQQAQFNTRKLAREEGVAEGRYVRAEDARYQLGENGARIMQVIEGGVPDLAMAVAVEFSIDARQVRHVLQKELRNVRAKAAKLFRKAGADAPATVDDVVAEPEAMGHA